VGEGMLLGSLIMGVVWRRASDEADEGAFGKFL
jgi:hypothetical protein